MAYHYVPRVGQVYSKTLTSSFVQVLTAAQAKNIRGFKMKVRVTPGGAAPGFFDIAFTSSPDTSEDVTDGTGFLSYTGSGLGDMFGPSNGVWARTRSSGTTVLEIITYN